MRLFPFRIFQIGSVFALATAAAYGQNMGASYNAAAESWTRAAASCKNPIAVACMMKQAAYARCQASQLISGASVSCAAPTCSSSCAGSTPLPGSSAAASSSLSKLEKDAGIGMAVFSAFKMLSKAGDTTAASQVPAELNQDQIAAQQAAAQAAQQQQINSDAASILNAANELVAENTPPPGMPDPSASTANTVAGLLDDTPSPASDTSSEVASLLGDTPDPNAATDNTVASLLNDTPDSNTPDPATSALTPSDPGMSAAQANSVDPPVPASDVASIQPEADVPNPPASVIDNLKDGLQNVISSVKDTVADAQATLSSMMNSPTGQLFSGLKGISDGDVPDLQSTDTAEEMSDKVSAQSFLGFSKLFGTNPWKGTVDYATGVINKGMQQIGFAAGAP
jgi:hypothetical protein